MTFKLLSTLLAASLLAGGFHSGALAAPSSLSLPAILLLMTLLNAVVYLLVRLLFLKLSPRGK
ncbi:MULTISPECIES: hypothetical protein [Aquitalea]|uniref:Uncharacterized protein n=1 Tax=Aquitalea magnusonii TaxID=332411 RepID=A0A318JP69_9NEIS|nr:MULTISPECIES: hypothetical protein [Aquitalea]PXX50969.1 hypothetical protein DFR38_10124 [Aquitalea magnusonii]